MGFKDTPHLPIIHFPIIHKHKRYKAYQLETPEHERSIIKNYGMPPTAHTPSIPEDIIEKVIKESYVSPQMLWNSRSKIKAGKANG